MLYNENIEILSIEGEIRMILITGKNGKSKWLVNRDFGKTLMINYTKFTYPFIENLLTVDAEYMKPEDAYGWFIKNKDDLLEYDTIIWSFPVSDVNVEDFKSIEKHFGKNVILMVQTDDELKIETL